MLRKLTEPFIILCLLAVLAACTGDIKANETTPTEETNVDGLTEDGKIVLTFAYAESTQHEDEISIFNTSQDVYEIRTVDYCPEEDMDSVEVKQNLLNDLASGEGPDIIDLGTFGIYVDKTEFNQYFEDLYPYIDDDPELSREDFIQSFLGAYEVDGALYSTANHLKLYAVAVAASVADAETGWNIQQLGDTAELVEGADNLSYVKKSNSDFFSSLLKLYIYDFVDLESSTVSFDQGAYRDFLQLCGQMTDEHYSGEEINTEGVLYADWVRSFFYSQFYEILFQDDFVFASGLDNSYQSYWSEPGDKLAMNTSCENKEGAWEFLRIFFMEEYQLTYASFPSNIAALESRIEDAKAGLYEKTVFRLINGEQVSKILDYNVATSFDSSDLEYGSATEAQIQKVLDLINSTTRIYKSEIFSCKTVACRYAQKYFKGEISLDEAVETAQGQAEALISAS